jgi:hypothetical protein
MVVKRYPAHQLYAMLCDFGGCPHAAIAAVPKSIPQIKVVILWCGWGEKLCLCSVLQAVGNLVVLLFLFSKMPFLVSVR